MARRGSRRRGGVDRRGTETELRRDRRSTEMELRVDRRGTETEPRVDRRGTEMELRVERLVNGAGSLARAKDGIVVLLDDGLPGERVRARIEADRRGFLQARVVRLLEAAPARRPAPCEVVALCGGCPWQSLTYPEQLEAKREVVLREIRRACGVEPDEVAPTLSGAEWRTRHRIRLAVARREGGRAAVGYRSRGTHAVVPIADCPIAREELIAALPAVRRLAEIERSVREVEVSVDDRASVYLRGICLARNPPSIDALWDAVRIGVDEEAGAGPAGLVLESAERPVAWRREAGEVVGRFEVAPGVEIGVPVGAFTQVNPEMNRALVATVVTEVAGPDGRFVLDLFCGAGNFSLPVARAGADVLGIDADARAVAAASASAAALGLGGSARFRTAPAGAAALADLPRAPDAVILDPPRAGAAGVLPALLALRPPRIVYVSCDVATLGRDARQILAAGWRFSSLRLVDLTPQTHRAEVLGVFRLTWERDRPYRA